MSLLKPQPNTRKALMAFAVFLIVAAVLGAYFFLHVQQRKEYQSQKNFRVLEQISENIIRKAENFEENVKSVKEAIDSLEKNIEQKVYIEIHQNQTDLKQTKAQRERIDRAMAQSKPKSSSVDANIASQIENEKTSTGLLHKLENQSQRVTRTFDSLKDISLINKNLSVTLVDTSNIAEGRPIVENGKIIQKLKTSKDVVLTVWQDLESFLQPLLWEAVFDEHLIIKPNGRLIFKNAKTGVFHIYTDSLFLIQKGENSLIASTEKTVHFKGEKYRLFVHPFKLHNGQQLMLVGLQSNDKFNAHSREVSSFTLVFSVSLFLLLLLSLPFLKLVFLSKTERLNRFDLVLTFSSLFAITCLLALLVLDLFQYKNARDNELEKNLNKVAHRVESSLKQEMKDALQQLQIYDRLFSTGGFMEDHDTIKKNDDLCPTKYHDFDMVTWIGKDGWQKNKWSVESKGTVKADVRQRKYFQKIAGREGWAWHKHHIPSFYLESIYSINTGEPYAVLSIPSDTSGTDKKDITVASITATPRTLFAPQLSHGYQFAIIDGEGRILFHSDKKRNLQENLLDDMSNANEIRSSIMSRTYCTFNTSYSTKTYKASILPLENWPIYLVTFYDTGYLKTANAEILSFSIIMLISYCLLLLLLGSIIYLNTHHWGRLQFKISHINWLIPNEKRSGLYQKVCIFYMLAGLTYLGAGMFMQHSFPDSYSQLLLLSFLHPLYLVGCSYLLLNGKITLWPLNRRYGAVIISILFGVALINTLSFQLGAKTFNAPFICFLIYQAVMLVVFFIFKFMPAFRPKWKLSFPEHYKMAILSFLLTACLPPVFTYFKISHDTEFRLYSKLVQLDYARKLEAYGRKEGSKKWPEVKKQLLQNDLPVNLLHSPLIELTHSGGQQNTGLRPDTIFTDIYSELRPLYSNRPVETNHLNESKIAGNSWSWVDRNDEIIFHFDSPFFKDGGRQLRLRTSLFPFNLPSYQGWLIFWFISVSLLFAALLYFLIGFVLKKIVVSQQFRPDPQVEKDFIKTLVMGKGNPDAERNIFLIGLPHAGKTRFLKEIIFQQQKNYRIIDFHELANQTEKQLFKQVPSRPSILVLDHFEFGMRDPDILLKKLNFIESIIQLDRHMMVVVSTIHPLNLMSSVSLGQMTGATTEEAQKLSGRWAGVMDDFYKAFFINLKTPLDISDEIEDLDMSGLIESECQHVDFLKTLKKGLKEFANKTNPGNQEIILRIQSMAAFYYYSIWKTCTAEEKYLLYDLAQDGIVNISNVKVISALKNKGILFSDGTLRLMNRSFRNFILTTVNPEEALALEKEVNQSSTWQVIRLPLLVTLIALGVFIFFTQRGVYNNVIAFVGSLAAALPILFKLLGSLPGKKSPTE